MKIYNNNQMPVKHENFMWIAEYNKEDIHKRLFLPEFEFKNGGFGHVKHTFDEINKDKLSSLGLMGNGYNFSYNTEDGIFDIYNSKIDLRYFDEDSQKEYKFMDKSNGLFNDIILYKTVADTFDISTKTSSKRTLEYGLGYKKIIDDFNIKAIFHLSMKINTMPFLTFKITSPKDLDGELRFYLNNKIAVIIKSPLKADLGKTFTINIG